MTNSTASPASTMPGSGIQTSDSTSATTVTAATTASAGPDVSAP